MVTRRKINFTAVVRYSAYRWGKPGTSVLTSGGDNVPVACTIYGGVSAHDSATAKAKLTVDCLARPGCLGVTSIELTLRFPNQDAALLAERDAAAPDTIWTYDAQGKRLHGRPNFDKPGVAELVEREAFEGECAANPPRSSSILLRRMRQINEFEASRERTP